GPTCGVNQTKPNQPKRGNQMTDHTYEQLPPGIYVDSWWGVYQTNRVIDLALSLGWSPDDRDTIAELNAKADDRYALTPDDYGILYDAQAEAEGWINEHCVPEGYWFGHHPYADG